MSYLEELLPEFRKGAKIRIKDWDESEYLCIKDSEIIDENGVYHAELYGRYLTSDRWELYQEPIDWDYIIENKCLCWFWDDCQNRGRFGILVNVNYDDENLCSPYKESWGDVWENFCPVRRDEVTFYEDRDND